MAIRITENQFANLPAFVMKQVRAATEQVVIKAAQKAYEDARRQAHLISWSGEYKNGFTLDVSKGKDVVVRVYNDAPHAEAIEVGQTPYVISSVEFYRIVKWAQMKLGVEYSKALFIARSVAKRIAEHGKYALGMNKNKAQYTLKIAVARTSMEIPKTWRAAVKKRLESMRVPG